MKKTITDSDFQKEVEQAIEAIKKRESGIKVADIRTVSIRRDSEFIGIPVKSIVFSLNENFGHVSISANSQEDIQRFLDGLGITGLDVTLAQNCLIIPRLEGDPE